jgi:phosphate transport system substrate-binding protein
MSGARHGSARPIGRRAMLAFALACAGCAEGGALVLRGAGATLPHRLYTHWIDRYASVARSVRIDYQAVGSASGLRQLYARMADFGASDAPARGAPFDLLHVPTAVGAVALAHRLPRPLVLRPPAVAAIVAGQASRWSDPRIAADNPGAELPDVPVIPIFRSDGSGATQIFTEWLGDALGSPRRGMSSHFPAGLGARGSDGVAAAIARVPGALGYVEVAYAKAAQLSVAEIASHEGAAPIAPTDASVDLAADSLPADVPLTTRLGGESSGGYPLASFTYLLVPRVTPDDGRSSALARFFFWVLGPGQEDCAKLGYRALPPAVAARARRILIDDLVAGSRPALRAD